MKMRASPTFCLLCQAIYVSGFIGQQQRLLSPTTTTSSGRLWSTGDGNPPPFDSFFNTATTTTPPTSPQVTTAQSSPPQENTAGSVASSGGNMIGSDPIESLDLLQKTALSDLLGSVSDLTFKADLSQEGEGIQGSALRGYDAPGASNVAWLADLCVPGKMSSLTLFNGPLTDVPHIFCRCYIGGGGLELSLDIRPRAYGAYEMKDSAGNYPGPEELGRKAFEYSGARNDFFNKFGTDEVRALLDPSQFDGASERMPFEQDKVIDGPLALHLSMPITPTNVDRIASIKQKLVSYWIAWSKEEDHRHRPGAPINAQYVYDAKYRQNSYLALLQTYTDYFGGTDGARLAAAESGPLDEAYVGGGS